MAQRDEATLEREIAPLRRPGALLDGVPIPLERIVRFQREIASGRASPAANRIEPPPEPPLPGDIEMLAALSLSERAELESRGQSEIRAGRVAVAVLNGGMATRFGGQVKGAVEAFEGRSFLEIKALQAQRLGPVPLVVMNSFATRTRTLEHLHERGLASRVYPFVQSACLRLTPEGELYRDANGRASPYAPGHGDFGERLRASGTLDALRSSGVHTLALSNVDNLGAELDPLVIGYHRARAHALTAEIVPSASGDSGGSPGRVAGRLQLVEGFCYPEHFDPASFPYSNTNSLVLSLEALDRDSPLTWYCVEKRVEGRRAIQMERLVGELTAFLDTSFLVVPRGVPDGRYFPVKRPADLDALRAEPALVSRFAGLGSAAVVRG